MPELAKGFTCACGKYEKYPPYVYAHWTTVLVFTCECGRKYQLHGGKAKEDK